MSDRPDAPSPRIESDAPAPWWRSVSLVWAIPLAALIVAAVVTVQTFTARGPMLIVSFENAAGVVAGQTPVRYRDVTIGTVEDVSFGTGLEDVRVHIRLDEAIASYVTEEAIFWIVRPQVTAQGISGLSTVIGGPYISASLPDSPGRTATRLTGSESAPLTPLDAPGLRITLRTALASSITLGSPVLYKGIEVGQVEDLDLSGDGRTLIFTAFVREPYNNLITDGTRFWDASGFSFSLDGRGATLDVDSLAALLRGGVSFDTVFEGGALVTEDRGFRLYPDAEEARGSLFDTLERAPVTVSAVFAGSVSGLRVGAPVTFRGIPVGVVTSLSARLAELDGRREVELVAAFEIEPGRLGLPAGSSREVTLDLLAELVAEGGMRAQLGSPSILTGAQRIELAELPGADPAVLDRTQAPFPRIPSVDTPQTGLAETAEGLISRIDELPIEAVLTAATQALNAVTTLLSDPELRGIPAEANGAIADLRSILQSDGVTQAPGELLAGLTALRGLLEEAQEAALVEAFATAVTDVATLSRTLDQTTTDIAPALSETLASAAAFADAAQVLLADEATRALPAQAEALLADLRAVTSDPDLQDAPEALARALQQAEAILNEFRGEEIARRLGDALDNGAAAAGNISELAADAADLPATLTALIDEVDALTGTAQALFADPDLAAAPAELTGLLRSARAILDDEATRALPAEALQGLAALNTTLAAIEEAGVANLLAQSLTSAREAADRLAGVAEASEGVPGALEGLLGSADALISDPDTRRLTGEATATLAALRVLLEDPQTQAIPAELAGGVRSARVLLDDLIAAELGERLQVALADAGRAAAAVAEASEGVPDLVARIDAVVADAEAVALDDLARQAQDVLASADAILAAPGARELPASLNSALGEVRVTLEELRGAGVARGLGDTLSATERAAEAIRLAALDVPALLRRLDAVTAQAGVTIAAYGEGSLVNDEALRAIREFRDTARAITALVRQIERNPNSLLVGR